MVDVFVELYWPILLTNVTDVKINLLAVKLDLMCMETPYSNFRTSSIGSKQIATGVNITARRARWIGQCARPGISIAAPRTF